MFLWLKEYGFSMVYIYLRTPFLKNDILNAKSNETSLILTPVLSDEAVKKLITRYKGMIEADGGKIIGDDFWGLKPMAYPIQKKTTGIYNVMEWAGPAESVAKLEAQFRIDENLLRFMTIRLDKYSIDYNDRKRKGLIGRKKKKQETEEA